MISVAVLQRARRRVWRCDHGGLPGVPPGFYREVGRGRWQLSPDATFESVIPIPQRTRAEIEACGHRLVPVDVPAGGGLR